MFRLLVIGRQYLKRHLEGVNERFPMEGSMSEKVQFNTNIPVEVSLKYGDGKDVTGQYGDQVLYTLTDGRVMYVPPIVRKQIEELGIPKGEPFTITKAEKKNGTRRTIEWLVTTNRRKVSPSAVASKNNRERPGANRGSEIQNGHGADVARPRGSPGADRPSLLQAFTKAVDVAAEAERYAAAHGISLQFTSEDVREIGLSIFTTG